jgi:hypothetical protein
MEHDAIELAKLTPASGWGKLPDPATVKLPPSTVEHETVKLAFTKAELEARIQRAYRQLGSKPSGETHQHYVDRIAADSYSLHLLHTMRVAYINLEALS